MANIDLNISNWEGLVSISPEVEDEEAFKKLGGLSLMTVDRRMILNPHPDGHKPAVLERARHAGLGIRYEWRGVKILSVVNFQRHLVQMLVDDKDEMTWDIPPCHELPWPVFYKMINPVVRDTIILREFTYRVRSCVKAGGERAELERLCAGTPDIVKSTIPNTTWSHVLRTGGDMPCM